MYINTNVQTIKNWMIKISSQTATQGHHWCIKVSNVLNMFLKKSKNNF